MTRTLVWIGVVGCAGVLSSASPAWAQHPELEAADQTPEGCLGCHDNVKEVMGAKPHKALGGGCLVCHDVAKAEQSPFLRADASTLCAACHQVAPTQAAAAKSAVAAPVLAMPAALIPRRKQLNLNPQGVGHPVANHPVGGASDPNKPDRPLSCVSCHLPHGGPEQKLLAFPPANFCERCHKV